MKTHMVTFELGGGIPKKTLEQLTRLFDDLTIIERSGVAYAQYIRLGKNRKLVEFVAKVQLRKLGWKTLW